MVECMALNIKNERTQKLAQELSELTGESMTVAVTEAVRERQERGTGLAQRRSKSARTARPI
jgi:hypothetical protein